VDQLEYCVGSTLPCKNNRKVHLIIEFWVNWMGIGVNGKSVRVLLPRGTEEMPVFRISGYVIGGILDLVVVAVVVIQIHREDS